MNAVGDFVRTITAKEQQTIYKILFYLGVEINYHPFFGRPSFMLLR
jgi:hypothetical protein